MSYIFRGNLCGYLCTDCSEKLSGINVRIYRLDEKQDVIAAAAAHPDDTFHQLSDDEIKRKKGRLIKEATTDDKGDFVLTFDDKEKYDGKAFEIDIAISKGYRQENYSEDESGDLQFHITTVQPYWRETSDEGTRALSYYWEYCIAARWWCRILALLDLWVICGQVTDCEEGIAIANVKVLAFDADWLQHDPLGSAFTDTSGHFTIYYTRAQFEKTIFSWINLEWVSGPDLYFRVESASGVQLLQEPVGKGRTHGRRNVGNCFCVKLCVDVDVPPEVPVPVPAFLRVGGYNYQTEINAAPFGNGLTTGSNYAFFSSVRLNGIVAQETGGQPLEYCFEYTHDFNGLGAPINWQRVLPGQIPQTNIGYIEKAVLVTPPLPDLPYYDYNNVDCYVSSVPIPGAFVTAPSAQGWILVPQQDDNPLDPTGDGLFVSNSNQIMLDTTTLMAFPPVNLAGLVAGNDATSTGQPLAQDEVFALRMLVRQQGNDATKVQAGMCRRIAIDNTLYNGMVHHPSWGSWGPTTEYGVCMVDIQQLIAMGCAKITTQVDILYTVAHPNLGSFGITMTGPLGTESFGPFAVSPNEFGTVTRVFTPADPECAYLVTLTATYLLTTGDSNLSSVQDQIAFCR